MTLPKRRWKPIGRRRILLVWWILTKSRSWSRLPDKVGTGWHVIIRYRQGHERRIEGFTTKSEAVDWIEANSTQVDE